MALSQPGVNFTFKAFSSFIAVSLIASILYSPLEIVLGINSMHHPILDLIFVLLTNLGNGLILIPFIILLSFRNLSWSIGLITSGIAEGIIVSICKHLLFKSAKRPLYILDPSHVHLVPGIEVHTGLSFPSGHTVTVFGLCTFLSLCYKHNLTTFSLVVLASLVGLSRVYLLQHYLGDVTGGAIIGTVAGFGIFHWIEQINKPQWMNHRLEIKLKRTNQKTRFN